MSSSPFDCPYCHGASPTCNYCNDEGELSSSKDTRRPAQMNEKPSHPSTFTLEKQKDSYLIEYGNEINSMIMLEKLIGDLQVRINFWELRRDEQTNTKHRSQIENHISYLNQKKSIWLERLPALIFYTAKEVSSPQYIKRIKKRLLKPFRFRVSKKKRK